MRTGGDARASNPPSIAEEPLEPIGRYGIGTVYAPDEKAALIRRAA